MATHVQNRSVFDNANNPIQLAYTSNVSAGTMLYAMTVDGLNLLPTGVTDSALNTWAQVAAASIGAFAIALWKAPSGAAGANTVSVAFGSTPSSLLSIYEFSGMGTPTNGPSNTLDIALAGAVDPLTCATLATTAAGVLFCGVRLDSNYTYVGWTDNFVDVGTASRARTAYRITATGVSAAPAFDCSTTESGESLTAAMYDAAAGVTIPVFMAQYRQRWN